MNCKYNIIIMSKTKQNKIKQNKIRVVRPRLMASRPLISRPSPKFDAAPNGAVRVRNSECVTNLTTVEAVPFSILGKSNGYALNPGSSFTFPWLSSIARNYDKYRFLSLKITLQSSAPTVYGGRVHLCLDPDTTDQAPESVAEILTMKYHASSIVYKDCNLSLSGKDCESLHKPFSFAFCKPYNGVDQQSRSSNVGRFYVTCSGMSEAVDVVLNISYTVEFFDPQYCRENGEISTMTNDSFVGESSGNGKTIPFIPTAKYPWSVGEVGQAIVDLSRVVGSILSVSLSLYDKAATKSPTQIQSDPADTVFKVYDAAKRYITTIDPTDPSFRKVAPTGAPYQTTAEAPHSGGWTYVFDMVKLMTQVPKALYLEPWVKSFDAVDFRLISRIITEVL
jgi:hypothetical protein